MIIISRTPIESGCSIILITMIHFGTIRFISDGIRPTIHGVIHTLHSTDGIHGAGTPGTVLGVTLIAIIRGAGAIIAGTHPIITTTITDITMATGTTTTVTLTIITPVADDQEARMQFMVAEV